MDGLAQIFSDTSYTSLRYDDGLTLSWHMGGSVPNTVYTLADVFVEWFLFDSGEQKTLDDFLVAESMQNIFTSQQFMDVMSGAVHIDDRLCRVLPEILPFKITSHRLLAMNNLIKSTTPCMPYNIDAMHTKLKTVADAKRNKRKAYRHKYYVENKARLAEQMKDYYLEHRDTIRLYYKKWRSEHLAEQKAYHTAYRKNNANVVAERKKQSYQKKKDKYNARTRANYYANKDAILAQQRLYYQANKERIAQRQAKKHQEYMQDKELAARICPVFKFLMDLKYNDIEAFLTCFKKQEFIATKAKKQCTALQSGDWAQCVICSTGNVSDKCPLSMAFDFRGAVDRITEYVADIVKANQK